MGRHHRTVKPPIVDAGAPGFLELQAIRGRVGIRAQTDLLHVARARFLVSRLCGVDDSGSSLEAAAERAAEEEILALVSYVLEANGLPNVRNGRPRVARGQVIAKVLNAIEESEGKPLLLQDLCKVTRVSERTLRNVFQEYFGVGPMRLLKVRQLREIHTALMNAEAGAQTVAGIAASFGVWDVSGFTRNYKALYSETPAETLRRFHTPRNRNKAMGVPWLQYAARKFTVGVDNTNRSLLLARRE